MIDPLVCILYGIYALPCGSVAQSVEQWPFKPLVPGSSPGRPTTCPTEKLNPLVGMWGTGCPVEGIASYPNSNDSEYLYNFRDSLKRQGFDPIISIVRKEVGVEHMEVQLSH